MMTDEHIHAQRRKNNLWLSLILVGFVILIFFITIAKLRNSPPIEGYDHIIRPALQHHQESQ